MRVSIVAFLVFFLLGMVFAAPVAEAVPIAEAEAIADAVPGFTQYDKRSNAGDATWYLQGGAYGSCGKQNPDSALIVALSTTYCTSYNSPVCGRKIKITAVNGPTPGATVTATVADTCMGCKPNDVDCSVEVFNLLTNNNPDVGRFQVTWDWVQ